MHKGGDRGATLCDAIHAQHRHLAQVSGVQGGMWGLQRVVHL